MSSRNLSGKDTAVMRIRFKSWKPAVADPAPLDLGEVRFQLTGVDLDGKALAARQTEMHVASDHMGLIYAVEKDIPTAVTELAGAPSGLAAEAR
jgi:hypothetical protein